MVYQDQQNHWESLFDLNAPPLDLRSSADSIRDRTILITGAGGSIGSTLARTIASHHPRQLILLDASEQSLYRIDRDLKAPHHSVLGSIGDRDLLNDLFERLRPQLILHAAAFKHVPLMEFNPFAALQNNAVGTFILAQTAATFGAEQFVMVSTDKAVEPASIMGASKRIAELAILAMPPHPTQFKAVRLGNVLATEGSVLPLFQGQIDRGAPVTVTHPQASRYFLTMQSAADILQSALSTNDSGNILIPELGEPVLIRQIAERMIASVENERPSFLVFTGLRPGDKLTEKLIADDESFLPGSQPPPLHTIQSPAPSVAELEAAIEDLQHAIHERNLVELLRTVSQLVPGYKPSAVLQTALEQEAARCAQ